jgi:Glycosyl transferase family 2
LTSLERLRPSRLAHGVHRRAKKALAWPWQLYFDRRLERFNLGMEATLGRAREDWNREFGGQADPLVTVTIPTYNRGTLLVERTLPSVLAQTYPYFEVVVVGDHCTDDTAARIEALKDDRVTFTNLSQRPPYPEDPFLRWYVAGAWARNRALELARGAWLAHIDDDDTWTPDHIESLLRHALLRDLELVYGRYRRESRPGEWYESGGGPFPSGRRPFRGTGVLHSAAMYRSSLACIRYLTDGWRLAKALDYILTQRMARAGVRAGFLGQVVCEQPLRPGEAQNTARTLVRGAGSWRHRLLFMIVSG